MCWSRRFNSFRRTRRQQPVLLFVHAYYMPVHSANPLNALDVPEHDVILNVLRNLLPEVLHVDKGFVVGSASDLYGSEAR